MRQKLILLLVFLIPLTHLMAQSRQVTGTVTSDSTLGALTGVTVTLKGTGTMATTDAQGKYTITVPGNNSTLVFSYVGHEAKEVNVGSRNEIDVVLVSASTLADVVVIGYQTIQRRDLTGSVSSVNASQLRNVPINSAAEALAGRLAGVQITGTEGTPNAEVLIRVRGGGSITQDNSPLYIIDGVQVENALSVISPQDIQTIDVLKDAASTAIYGARGANGVVIITTKGGKNQRTTISYNGLVGVDRLANRLDVLDPYDFVMYQYERSRSSSQERTGFQNTYGRFEDLDLYRSVPFVDWQDQLFGRSALRHSHNISMSGGTAASQYNLSLTYNKQEGIQLGSDFDRKLVSFKFDHNFNKNLKVGFNTRYNNTVVNGAGTSNPGSSSTNRLRHSIKYRPLLMSGQGILDYDEAYADQTNDASLGLVNPILLNDAEYRKNVSNLINLSGYGDLKFTKYLSFRSTIGYDLYSIRQNAFDDSITGVAKQTSSGMPLASIGTVNRATVNNSNVLSFTNANIDGNFSDKNNITALLGHEIYQVRSFGENQNARQFPYGISAEKALANMNLGTAYINNGRPPTFESENHLVSAFGRLMYDYDKRFLTQFTYRADGSSKFAEGNKWGYFPSASIAWRISNEKFFEDLSSTFNDVKLRVSYGEAGNNRIGDFLYLTQYNSNTQYWLNDQFNTAFVPDALANENLVWETTISRNVGLDVSLLRNKFQFSFDAFRNSTRDLLVDIPVPTSSGYRLQQQNVGETSSRGFELQLAATIASSSNFGWEANFNASTNKVRVESLGTFQDYYYRNSGWGLSNSPADFVIREGELLGSMYGFITDGFYTTEDFIFTSGTPVLKPGVASNVNYTTTPAPGRLKFKDLDANGLIDENDKTVIGVAQPKWFGGLNQNFRYKNFDLGVFVNFQLGNDVYNANKLEFTSGYQGNTNLLSDMENRWRTVNSSGVVVTDSAELAALNRNAGIWMPNTSSTSFLLHSWAVEDGSFLRINNVTLGYNIPKSLASRMKVQSVRIYATVNNLAVFTKYTGYDPEVNTRRRTPETPGVDYSAYPRSRGFLAGINVSL
jgi:TonB-dependent starch-binding outer membrane protein SusC